MCWCFIHYYDVVLFIHSDLWVRGSDPCEGEIFRTLQTRP